MAEFDYIVLGAGTSGCVIANRLSESPSNRVLAGRGRRPRFNPCLHIPRMGARAFGNPRYTWRHETLPFGPNLTGETWPRGKVLGGSSSTNGMVYNRGSREDYDDLERLGNRGWGWDDILPGFLAFEGHQLGASPVRGGDGSVHVSVPSEPNDLALEMIAASTRLGMREVADINETGDARVGLPPATIHRGRRVSAATAFLHPVRHRSNLKIATRSLIERLVFENGRAVGAVIRTGGSHTVVRARREVIVCLGALGSPKLLQLSGIGPRDVLSAAGVPLYLERENVGRRMRDHRTLVNTYRLNADLGYNSQLSTPLAKLMTGMRYLATRNRSARHADRRRTGALQDRSDAVPGGRADARDAAHRGSPERGRPVRSRGRSRHHLHGRDTAADVGGKSLGDIAEPRGAIDDRSQLLRHRARPPRRRGGAAHHALDIRAVTHRRVHRVRDHAGRRCADG